MSVYHRGVVLLAAFLLLACPLRAQEDFPHPELSWRTIDTKHFFVHYHEGAERTARVIAKIAEDIYGPVTSFYEHEPDSKVSFIVKDYDDISNGAAYFYDNRIEIYAPSMDFELRGTHNWLRNVITHEFTHIIQIQTSMKFGRKVPAVYLQWLGYESERRVDVLYGYPNIVASYPISGFVVPAWFAEGVAQHNRRELQYDYWDTHRDMILRSYALDGNMLTWEQMGVFGKTSLGNESSYNAGFAFIRYFGERFGEAKLREVSRNLSRFDAATIDGAIERAVGIRGADLYDEWKAELTRSYRERVAPVRALLREGAALVTDSLYEVIDPGEGIRLESMMRNPLMPGAGRRDATVGFANLYPVYSPDGSKLAFTSAKNGDYFGLSSLFVYDFTTHKETLVQPGVRTAPAWSPDGTKLYYGRSGRDNPHWSLQFDIYEYDLKSEEERRVTFGRRAISPTVSPDGEKIAFVVSRDGTANLAVTNRDGSGYREITLYANGEQVYNPCWSPDGSRIVFDHSIKDGRDIAWIRPDGSDLAFLVTGDDDQRAARFAPDGKTFWFSADRGGIFNIYRYDIASQRIDQMTNVLGGAFYPTVSAGGDLVYAAYTSGGYKIYRYTAPPPVPAGEHRYEPGPLDGRFPAPVVASNAQGRFDWSALRDYDDTKGLTDSSRAYRSVFTNLSVVPVIRVDNYNPKSKGIDVIKVGAYVFSTDVLDRTSFFAGATLNARLERDLFLQFTYRGRLPLLYELGLEPVASLELYNITRKTNNVISLPASTIPVDVGYNLLEVDLALAQPVFSQFANAELRFMHSRYTSIIESFINPETTPPSLVSSSSDLYLIANDLSLTFRVDALLPSRTQEINPVGRKIKFRLGREWNKFNGDGEYEVTSTGLHPLYKNVNITRAELQWREYLPFLFKNHTLSMNLRGGSIIGPPVDEFFDFYAGGLIGMKGYPFYAIGGNELATMGVTWRFPLVHNIDVRLAHLYFDKLYAAVFADAGYAWTDFRPRLKDFKKDVGVELRLESFSYYAYPTRIFLSAAYGLDKFERYIRSRDQYVTYGQEWRIYFGILFGFELD
ncbi:MAG: PD40 domain-containing protein [Ignavibacteriae bacterium]|nr:PD40 domain-containing protein [Ignavibacteriota bacterium]